MVSAAHASRRNGRTIYVAPPDTFHEDKMYLSHYKSLKYLRLF